MGRPKIRPLTPLEEDFFLEIIGHGATIKEACHRLNVSCHYYWAHRRNNAAFAAKVDNVRNEAKKAFLEAAETEMYKAMFTMWTEDKIEWEPKLDGHGYRMRHKDGTLVMQEVSKSTRTLPDKYYGWVLTMLSRMDPAHWAYKSPEILNVNVQQDIENPTTLATSLMDKCNNILAERN